ncbi:MAG: O-methyltransferase [Saprospiraceae bacterium]|nr:O-methyltransferase [Saprospiraceae bacterium]
MTAYLEKHISPLHADLSVLERNTHLSVLQPHMMSGMHQGVLLKILALLSGAKHVLEIGTFTGFSALCFADAVGEGGKVVTIEKDAELAEIARVNFSKAGFGARIALIEGNAAELMPSILREYDFDLVFIDADKTANALYYDMAFEALRPGALILIDNVLWKGKVADETITDNITTQTRTLNNKIASDPGVDACIIPIRDGLWLIRKK